MMFLHMFLKKLNRKIKYNIMKDLNTALFLKFRLKQIIEFMSAMNPTEQDLPKVKIEEKTSYTEVHGTIHQNQVAKRDLK